MRYYGVEDVMKITGAGQNKCYEIIRELNKQYKKKFPEAIMIQGQVAQWYFEEAMGFKEKERVDENEKDEAKTVS